MSLKKSLALLALSFLFLPLLRAQVYNWADGEEPDEPVTLENLQGLVVGLNIGFYQANHSTAAIYGGYGFDRAGERNGFSNSWLNNTIQGNPEFRRRTSDAMGLSDGEWSFTESDMPNEMRYRPSFMWGAHGRFHLNPDFAIFAEVGGTSPVTVGEFTITNLTAAPGQLQDQFINNFSIRGEEQRLLFTLGVRQSIGRKAVEQRGGNTAILPFIEFGLNSTFVSFEENFIDLNGNVLDLTLFFQQQGFLVDEARVLTGVGFGGFTTLGAQIHLGGDIMVDLAYRPSFEHVRLGAWDDRSLQHIFLLRAVWTRF